MYSSETSGVASVTAGAIILPNTGGHIILQIVAFTCIAVGTAILLSYFARWIAKRNYSKA